MVDDALCKRGVRYKQIARGTWLDAWRAAWLNRRRLSATIESGRDETNFEGGCGDSSHRGRLRSISVAQHVQAAQSQGCGGRAANELASSHTAPAQCIGFDHRLHRCGPHLAVGDGL